MCAQHIFIESAFSLIRQCELGHSQSMHGNRKWSKPIYVVSCQIGGAPFSYPAYRESKPYTGDTKNGRLHFLFSTISFEPGEHLKECLAAHHSTIMKNSPYIHHYSKGKYIHFPESISEIAEGGLLGENINTIVIPEGIVTIKRAAFLASSVTSISLPESLSVIEADAFCGCTQLKTLYLPKGLTKIEARAFMGCYLLEKIQIPENVKFIGDEAFAFCRNLKTVILSEKTQLGHTVFHESPFNP